MLHNEKRKTGSIKSPSGRTGRKRATKGAKTEAGKNETEDFLKETQIQETGKKGKQKKERKASKKELPEEANTENQFLEEPFVPENAFPIHRAEELVQDLEEIVPAATEEKETSRKIPVLPKQKLNRAFMK